ncbi:ATP-binding protein [Bacillaceae bacterium W0354]
MGLKQIPIRLKITILTFGVVLFTLLISGIILLGKSIQAKEADLGERGLTIGRLVANLPEVKENLSASDGFEAINQMVDQIRSVNDTDYIVVLNMNRIRYSHPVVEKLGTISSGQDEGAAFAEHSYYTKAQGEVGTVIRSFVPIMDDSHEQIGVVIVGNMLPTVFEIMKSFQSEILLTLLITILFGIIGSWLLARHVKDQTFQLEPHEIARLLNERTAIFQAMNEGVIAVDRDHHIAVFNEEAKKLLNMNDKLIGKSVEDIQEKEIRHFLQDKSELDNEIILIKDKHFLTSRVPIYIQGEEVGTLTVFMDHTEMTKMAEELSGVKAFVDALRVQNHEHMNKLHTIAGLIQLDQKDRALNYVFETTEEQKKISSFLTKNILDYSVAGLLISKIQRGKELGIEVIIDPHTKLLSYPEKLERNDFVILIGNLIENAFEALIGKDEVKKVINVSINQNGDYLQLTVKDNGKGMTEQTIDKIFTKGFTTKDKKGSGIGLYLIQKVVEKAHGYVQVDSTVGEGTCITINLPIKAGEYDVNVRQI